MKPIKKTSNTAIEFFMRRLLIKLGFLPKYRKKNFDFIAF